MPVSWIESKNKVLWRPAVCLLALILISGKMAGPAFGYVLDGRHVLELMLEHMDLPNQMRIEQTLTVFDERFENGQMKIDQTVWYKIPDNFRTEIKTDTLHRIYVAAGDKTLTIVDGKIVSQTREAHHHYKDLFCYHARKALGDHLAYLGVNVAKSSYGRWEKNVAFVIGAQYPDESIPQLWVDKSSFLPMRWIYQVANPSAGLDRIEFRYENWQQAGGSWYPHVIEIINGERLMRRIDVNQIKINPVVSNGFFDFDHLKAVYTKPHSGTEQPEPYGDIDQQIKEFRDIFESQ